MLSQEAAVALGQSTLRDEEAAAKAAATRKRKREPKTQARVSRYRRRQTHRESLKASSSILQENVFTILQSRA
jgi:hypothetical protein